MPNLSKVSIMLDQWGMMMKYDVQKRNENDESIKSSRQI